MINCERFYATYYVQWKGKCGEWFYFPGAFFDREDHAVEAYKEISRSHDVECRIYAIQKGVL